MNKRQVDDFKSSKTYTSCMQYFIHLKTLHHTLIKIETQNIYLDGIK